MLELQNKFLKPTANLRNLQVLEEISKDPAISQRKLSQRLGVALGVTNACLKKMVTKGLIKAKGINHKRIVYYLTPQGFIEKTSLTYHFLEHTIRFYANLKNNVSARLCALSQAGYRRIVCYGAGEVMEVVFVVLSGTDLKLSVVGLIDDDREKQGARLFGFTVQSPRVIKDLKPDAVLVTSVKYRDEIMRKLNSSARLNGMDFYVL